MAGCAASLAIAASSLATPPSAGAVPAPGQTVDAAVIVQAIGRREPVQLADVHIIGPLDLSALSQVAGPLQCRACQIDNLTVGNVTFARAVDLSGSTIAGPVHASGAVFNGAVLLAGATFRGDIDLADAQFTDVVDFSGATIAGAARFDDDRFAGDARFDNIDAQGPASFVAAAFSHRASFSGVRTDGLAPRQPVTGAGCGPSLATGGGFEQRADFRQASFGGDVDLRQMCVVGTAGFSQTSFGGVVSAAQARFSGEAIFDGARFDGGASFVDAHFDALTTFARVAAGGRLDFEAASFGGIPVFSHLASTGVVSFVDARFTGKVIFDKVDAKELDLAFADVPRMGAARADVLVLIEDGARGRGNIALANQARYNRLALQGTTGPPMHRAADWLFYRVVAGYLVRPLRPLLWLLAAVLVASLVRAIRAASRRGSRTIAESSESAIHGAFSRYLLNVERTVGVVVAKKASRADNTDQPMATVRQWVEWGLYKALLVAFIVGVANSNATLRQMLDAIK